MQRKFSRYRCLDGKNLDIYQKLDSYFSSLVDKYNPIKLQIPSLIDEDILKRSGFFNSFPHQLIAAGFVEQGDYDKVIKSNSLSEENIKLKQVYLTPSACLHIYPIIEENNLTNNQVITTQVRVYRNEDDSRVSKVRLNDFSVREIVFVGDREFVESELSNVFNDAYDIAKSITSNANIITATDSFYPNQINDVKKKLQKHVKSKNELIIPIGSENVAVASSNFHDYHFSIPFNFDNDRKVVTGCIGFGLERWVAACEEYNINDGSLENIKNVLKSTIHTR